LNNPFIVLITGIQNEEGHITDCNITFKEVEDVKIEEAILYTGAAIGAHSVAYAMELEEKLEAQREFFAQIKNMFENAFRNAQEQQELPDVILLPENAGDVIDENGEKVVDLFEEAEEQEETVVVSEDDNEQEKEKEEVVVKEQEEIEEKQEEEQEEVKSKDETPTRAEIGEVIKKTPDSPAKSLLRRILNNFKKIK